MKVMLDTNILVSMIFFPSSITKSFSQILFQYYQVALCDYVIEELYLVTKRKFPQKLHSLEHFFNELPFELVYTPKQLDLNNFPVVRDIKDSPILATALLHNIEIFITGDKDFHVLQISSPKILSMTDFILFHHSTISY